MAHELVTIHTFLLQPEAEAARLHLREAGIAAMLADGEAVGMDWLLGNALGNIKLLVPRDQAEAARRALQLGTNGKSGPGKKRRRPRGVRGNKGRAGSGERCLACGAALSPDRPRCSACGWTYLADEEVESAEETPAGGANEDGPPARGVMDGFRAMRRPVLWLFVSPYLLMLAAGVLVLLAWASVKLTFVR